MWPRGPNKDTRVADLDWVMPHNSALSLEEGLELPSTEGGQETALCSSWSWWSLQRLLLPLALLISWWQSTFVILKQFVHLSPTELALLLLFSGRVCVHSAAAADGPWVCVAVYLCVCKSKASRERWTSASSRLDRLLSCRFSAWQMTRHKGRAHNRGTSTERLGHQGQHAAYLDFTAELSCTVLLLHQILTDDSTQHLKHVCLNSLL